VADAALQLKILIILNGISRKKKLFYSRIYPRLQEKFHPDIWETKHAGHAEALASEAVQKGYEIILSAGGDGTMHQVVNGVLSNKENANPLVGLIPLGSGNDLARSLGVTTDTDSIIGSLERRTARSLDVGSLTSHDEKGQIISRYFINECSMGMGPDVVRRVNKNAGRGLTAGLMYTKAIVTTFLTLRPERIDVKADGLSWSGKSRVMVVANGQTFGHGIYIGPGAKMDDGYFNLFVAANPSLLRFLFLLQQLRRSAKSTDKHLTYTESRSVEVRADKPLPVEADGEPAGFSPIRCVMVRNKLRFLA
jgi:diacylglycerol kinase (ATP)